jgi:multiple sugar transport system ATP-binding protein
LGGLSLRGIAKRYGSLEVLRDLSLEIEEGEFAVFLGPSGCGKSTLLRMVAGLESVSAGEIHLGARRIDGLPPGERGVAMVFQHYALYPHMTVRQNMAFGLRNVGVPAATVRVKVDEAARMLEIGHLLDRRPTQLSGGQRQRVAIGRAIVKEPTAFLFDEPLSNLDAALRSRTRVELARLHQAMRATMVFVTHDQMEAMTLATRIVVLNSGRIEQVGTPADIYARPRTRFVAGFIGTPAMNFLPVEAVVEEDGRAVALLGNGSRITTGIPIGSLGRRGELTLGVRAEHIHAGQGSPATIDVLERLGDRTLIYARTANGQVLVYDEPGHAPVNVGDRVRVEIDGNAVHLFDGEGRAYHAAEPVLQ